LRPTSIKDISGDEIENHFENCRFSFIKNELVIFVVSSVKRKRLEAGKDVKNSSVKEHTGGEMPYTDLTENRRASRDDYAELQTRNDDYSNIEAAGHAYGNAQVRV